MKQKNLELKLTKEATCLYNEKTKTLKKKIQDSTRRKDFPFSWIRIDTINTGGNGHPIKINIQIQHTHHQNSNIIHRNRKKE